MYASFCIYVSYFAAVIVKIKQIVKPHIHPRFVNISPFKKADELIFKQKFNFVNICRGVVKKN